MRKCVPLLILFVAIVGPRHASADPVGCSIGPPFTQAPVLATAVGNSAQAHTGCFTTWAGSDMAVFLGTDAFVGPGTLKLDFAETFTDGPGDEFALRTGTFWGPEGGPALLQFLLNGVLQYSRVTTLAPDGLFTFSLGPFASANQVWITNIAPDPPGVNNLTTITLIDAAAVAGDAPVPEPGTLLLLGSGLAAAFARRRYTAAPGAPKRRTAAQA